MSGGSFDYLYSKLENSALTEIAECIEDIKKMGEYLAADEEHNLSDPPDVANCMIKQYVRLDNVLGAMRHLLTPKFIALVRAIEWYVSNDILYDDVIKAYNDYQESL